jgi:hypothetical protein
MQSRLDQSDPGPLGDRLSRHAEDALGDQQVVREVEVLGQLRAEALEDFVARLNLCSM